ERRELLVAGAVQVEQLQEKAVARGQFLQRAAQLGDAPWILVLEGGGRRLGLHVEGPEAQPPLAALAPDVVQGDLGRDGAQVARERTAPAEGAERRVVVHDERQE